MESASRMVPYDRIEAWQEFLHGKSLEQTNAYAELPLGRESVYLYQSATAPPPCGARAGLWMSFPGTRELINYLRFCYLPSVWSMWLCREEWDDSYSSDDVHPIALSALFEQAQRNNNQYCADIPLMQRVVGLLDEGTWEGLEKAVRLVNRRWREAATWCFEMKLFLSPTAMGRHLRKHDGFCTVGHYKLSAWLAICESATVDSEASTTVLEVLAEALAT